MPNGRSPLFYSYATTPMHETIGDLLDTKQAPIYVVHFTQSPRWSGRRR